MNIVEKMKKDWDRRAGHDARYWIATEDYRSDDEFDRSGRKTAQAIVDLIGSERGELRGFRVLDIGCGIGRVLKPMAAHVGEVVGVDVSREMIERSGDWLAGVENARTTEGSGVDLSGLDDHSFDLAYSYIAFQHMPRTVFRRYLTETHRVLKDGGWLVFQMYLGSRRDHPLGDTLSLRVYEESELAAALEESGFRIAERRLEHRTLAGVASWLLLAARATPADDRAQPAVVNDDDADDLLSPMDGHLYRTLARNQLAEGHRDAAIETMRRHVELDASELSVALDLAALLVEDDRAAEAIEVLDSVTNVHPDFAEAYLSLAQLLALVGRQAAAADVVDRLRSNFPHDVALHHRAERLVTPVRS